MREFKELAATSGLGESRVNAALFLAGAGHRGENLNARGDVASSFSRRPRLCIKPIFTNRTMRTK
jgi:hypothetical protein